MMRTIDRLALLLGLFALTACRHLPANGGFAGLDEHAVAALNELRDQINGQYGFREGTPRVNLGPCGRVARDFREQWNNHFDQNIHIAFVMSRDRSMCQHVLVRLPNGNYFDGGNGVMTPARLLQIYPDCLIDEMTKFDAKLLDKRSYGLGREYPSCHNYSDEITARLIGTCLEKISLTKTAR
jgi:hypothetical protein